ncbi:hypothetical protein [Chelativorans sp. M5D2P16]|uniref:hypothetical protein n=1 Tax=Chelativorans sp. M5D2P16 TaxID=3095678 RepID=UPI002ACAE2A9|nr:hypothetical protein [Chelativorans sp. M5D2P16]MDZ5697493.1 hypothetical protein [Chelativorans sp. M5D2P16]
MQHLGGIHGTGVLKCGDKTLGRADYDFDGFLRKPGEVIGSGEIRMTPDRLRQVFGRKDLQFLTDEGRLLSLRFSDKHLPEASDAAHVDVAGDLPPQTEWRH